MAMLSMARVVPAAGWLRSCGPPGLPVAAVVVRRGGASRESAIRSTIKSATRSTHSRSPSPPASRTVFERPGNVADLGDGEDLETRQRLGVLVAPLRTGEFRVDGAPRAVAPSRDARGVRALHPGERIELPKEAAKVLAVEPRRGRAGRCRSSVSRRRRTSHM
jgi:hypothetical protein